MATAEDPVSGRMIMPWAGAVAEDDQARVVGIDVSEAEPGVRSDSGKESVRVVTADQDRALGAAAFDAAYRDGAAQTPDDATAGLDG